MVFFVDLEEEEEEVEGFRGPSDLGMDGVDGKKKEGFGSGSGSTNRGVDQEGQKIKEEEALNDAKTDQSDSTRNLNRNDMTEAFGCYPIISSIVAHLDINSLSHLSTTCRQIRVNLLQFRKQLLNSTLRCTNESLVPNPEHTLRYRARAADWYFVEEDGGRASGVGKVGECARDMVGHCRRSGCDMVVCRNCTIKPPAPILLQHRHRRLCKTCVKAPLETITMSSALLTNSIDDGRVFCSCPKGVWLCQPCGRSLRSADATYESIWRWRTSYREMLEGVGTGIGEGDRGVECGRGRDCLAAREVESETDCDAEDARSVHSNDQLLGSSLGSSVLESPGESFATCGGGGPQMGPGYLRHEIEGIGGKVKKKLVTMVKVGACVQDYEDEIEMGRCLAREIEGRQRSWCGWCRRVVRGKKDLRECPQGTKVA